MQPLQSFSLSRCRPPLAQSVLVCVFVPLSLSLSRLASNPFLYLPLFLSLSCSHTDTQIFVFASLINSPTSLQLPLVIPVLACLCFYEYLSLTHAFALHSFYPGLSSRYREFHLLLTSLIYGVTLTLLKFSHEIHLKRNEPLFTSP